MECFSRAEQRKMETYIMAKGGAKLFGVQLCLYTELRIGELLALEWSDLDLRRGRISVYKTCRDSWKNGRYEFEREHGIFVPHNFGKCFYVYPALNCAGCESVP